MRQLRIAELVANELRSEILDGTLAFGERLAPQDVLLKRFDVSLPAIREALGILEMEGIVAVRRGSVGGAIVQPPDSERIAYMTALVLQARRTKLSEVSTALGQFEPLCAAMCAGRADRHETVVPELNKLVEIQFAHIGSDDFLISETSLRFHEVIVEGCGNAAVALTVGGLMSLWRAHMKHWTTLVQPTGEFPEASLQEEIARAHRLIVDAIDAGDQDEVTRLAAKHTHRSHSHHLGEPSIGSDAMVDCNVLRS